MEGRGRHCCGVVVVVEGSEGGNLGVVFVIFVVEGSGFRNEVGVFFSGFVGGSAKEEILAWREAEVRGRTSSWFMWSLLSRAVALWSEVCVCFGGFVGGSAVVGRGEKVSQKIGGVWY